MAENYTQYPNQRSQFISLKPNLLKIFMQNLSKVFGALSLISIVLLLLNYFVGLDLFLDIFKTFGVEVSPSRLLLNAVLAVIGILVVSAAINYAVTRNIRYEFYQNKIVVHENKFLIAFVSKEIPYQNIVRVSYNNGGISNKLFNSGTISLETTGMKESKIELKHIDNAEQTVKEVQNLIQQFNHQRQGISSEGEKIEKILDDF